MAGGRNRRGPAGLSSASRQRPRQRCGCHVYIDGQQYNFISAAVLDVSRKSAVKEGADCIPVHNIHVSPATSFTADVL